MRLREVITVLNEMQADGVVDRYAIGGAVGATFYLEPVGTLDVDVFIEILAQASALLVSLEPIYSYLEERGGVREREYIVFADTPVQFLMPPLASVTTEALAQAVDQEFDDLKVHVFTAEHLAAAALDTGRSKDKARLVQFIDAGALDMDRFLDILHRHGLRPKWQQFERQFLSTDP